MLSLDLARNRDDALDLARNGHSAEALSMLKNVLQWAPQDEECSEKSATLEQELAEQSRTIMELAEKVRTVAVDNMRELKDMAESSPRGPLLRPRSMSLCNDSPNDLHPSPDSANPMDFYSTQNRIKKYHINSTCPSFRDQGDVNVGTSPLSTSSLRAVLHQPCGVLMGQLDPKWVEAKFP